MEVLPAASRDGFTAVRDIEYRSSRSSIESSFTSPALVLTAVGLFWAMQRIIYFSLN